jgi:hypothetical protein
MTVFLASLALAAEVTCDELKGMETPCSEATPGLRTPRSPWR